MERYTQGIADARAAMQRLICQEGKGAAAAGSQLLLQAHPESQDAYSQGFAAYVEAYQTSIEYNQRPISARKD